jgi:flavodoxin
MNTLVVYYSRTGNSRYLANKIAQRTGGDIEEIVPVIKLLPLQMLFSFIGKGAGIRKLSHSPQHYDRIVMCAPVWAGKLIAPLNDFLSKYRTHISKLYFALSCGSSDEEKDGKFGYASVFAQTKKKMGDACIHCEAFPIPLALPEQSRKDSDAIMKTWLSDENFSGEIARRFESFMIHLEDN